MLCARTIFLIFEDLSEIRIKERTLIMIMAG